MPTYLLDLNSNLDFLKKFLSMSKLRFLKINILFRGLDKFQSEIKADLMCEFERGWFVSPT